MSEYARCKGCVHCTYDKELGRWWCGIDYDIIVLDASEFCEHFIENSKKTKEVK